MEAKECYMLNKDQIQFHWCHIQEALDDNPSLWNLVHTKDSILAAALDGTIQVWAVASGEVINLCFMTQVYSTPANRFLQVFWMYGEDLPETLPLLDELMDKYAVANNCDIVEVVGRKGFERLLKPLGAEFMCSTFWRPVRIVKGH